MMLGKRARHPMKRTTSMTEFSFDDLTSTILEDQPQPQPQPQSQPSDPSTITDHQNHHQMMMDQRMMMAAIGSSSSKTKNNTSSMRRRSADFSLTRASKGTATGGRPLFLTYCSLCSRPLPPGRDIYMYRGDTAFCSLECRQQQMKQDEKKNKKLTSDSSRASPNSSVVSSSHEVETITAFR